MEAIQSYTGGLNQDTAKNKRSPNSYYYAKNFRVVTEEGTSSGSLENEKGTLLNFVVPNLSQMTLDDGTIIPAQTNLKIIGWCTIRTSIVLFTTSSNLDAPTNTVGQIWKLDYDEATNSVIGLINTNELDPSLHLRYNQRVNFSTYHKIKAIGRYETSNVQRVYWTDNYNVLRSFNVALANPDSLQVPLTNIDIVPGIKYSQANILEIGTGNLPTQSLIQFSSRLISNDGAVSFYSPTTPLLPLTQLYATTNFKDFVGSGSANDKSVTYSLVGLDTRFDVIEHIALVYTENDILTVYKFGEEKIPANGNLTVTCSDLSTAIEIPLVEFNAMSSGFSKCKDIESKKNRLIAANLREEEFLLDYDARAYRFNTLGEAKLYDSQGNFVVYNGVPNLAEDDDAINLYNDESQLNWATDFQYKYQSDGVTLGGEGVNISYTFTVKPIEGNLNNFRTVDAPHIDVGKFTPLDGTYSLNVLDADGNPKDIIIDGDFKNFASAWAPTFYKGYARGETYRFAIVFHSKKGGYSFAKWIGDIRFPDVEDGFPIQDEVGGFPVLNSLGIEFTVDTSSVSSEISGFSIVRVERTPENMTKLGTGMFMFFSTIDEGLPSATRTLINQWENGGSGSGSSIDHTDELEIAGVNYNGNYVLRDVPGYHSAQNSSLTALGFGYLVSPIGQLYGVNFKSGDYIKTNGFYDSLIHQYDAGATTTPNADAGYGFQYKLSNFIPSTNVIPTTPFCKERFQLNATQVLAEGQVLFSGNSFISGYTGVNNLVNAGYAKNSIKNYTPLGIGSRKMAITYKTTPTINNAINPTIAANNAWETLAYGSSYNSAGVDFAGGQSSTQKVLFKEVQYGRYLVNQYGGNSFVDRSKNQYISTGHFQVTEGLVPTTFTFEVFGGDVFVNYNDDEYIVQYWNTEQVNANPFKEPTGNHNRLSVAVCYPCESLVNCNYKERKHWASDRDGNNMGEYGNNVYTVEPIYLQENSSEEKFFDQDFLTSLNYEFPHTLWASDAKVDGELIDSWRLFKVANKLDLEGIYGPINCIINFKQQLFFYQESAFGITSIDERTLLTDDSGQQLVLGSGGVFPNYAYISNNTGTSHQWSVVATESTLYHYDSRLRKIYQYTGGASPLSDIKGLSSWLDKYAVGKIINTDKTLNGGNDGVNYPVGVHSVYDPRYNRVLFTFNGVLDAVTLQSLAVLGGYSIPEGTYFVYGSVTYLATEEVNLDEDLTGFDDLVGTSLIEVEKDYTFSYNEVLQSFESFYDYVPGIYLNAGRRLLSASPYTKNKAYLHNEGEYCKYYELDYSDSIIHSIYADKGNITKIFTNIWYLAELYDTNGNDIYNEPLSSIQLYNEYQDTGEVALTYDVNIKRRMRTWRFQVGRDSTDGNSRIRNPWVNTILKYQNNDNKRLVLHEQVYSYTPSKF